MAEVTHPSGYPLEHEHVLTLTHERDWNVVVCQCLWSFAGPERVVRAQILAHRMEHFPALRRRL